MVQPAPRHWLRGVVSDPLQSCLTMHLCFVSLHARCLQELCEGMAALDALPYVDLLDESDELLTHRWVPEWSRGTMRGH